MSSCGWPPLAGPGCPWRLVAAPGGLWRSLVAPGGGSWRPLAPCGGLWRLLADRGGLWRLLAGAVDCVAGGAAPTPRAPHPHQCVGSVAGTLLAACRACVAICEAGGAAPTPRTPLPLPLVGGAAAHHIAVDRRCGGVPPCLGSRFLSLAADLGAIARMLPLPATLSWIAAAAAYPSASARRF